MNSTSSFPKKNKESRQRAVWIAVSRSVSREILDHFSEYLPKFKKVIPYDYNRMQMAIVQMEEKGLNAEQAQIEAFYASTRA